MLVQDPGHAACRCVPAGAGAADDDDAGPFESSMKTEERKENGYGRWGDWGKCLLNSLQSSRSSRS